MQDSIEKTAELLGRSSRIMALTGAGISVGSGIPAFRGSQGLWERFDPMEYATIEAFCQDPAKVWTMHVELDGLIQNAKPGRAHNALARLEEMGRLSLVVTQNVDGLHQKAGSRNVVEFHGSGNHVICMDCGRRLSREETDFSSLPPSCVCGGILKPDVVFFGEPISEDSVQKAVAQASICQVMLVVATSAVVAPASHLPIIAKQAGAKVIEINLEPTPLTGEISDVMIQAPAGQALEAITSLLENQSQVSVI